MTLLSTNLFVQTSKSETHKITFFMAISLLLWAPPAPQSG